MGSSYKAKESYFVLTSWIESSCVIYSAVVLSNLLSSNGTRAVSCGVWLNFPSIARKANAINTFLLMVSCNRFLNCTKAVSVEVCVRTWIQGFLHKNLCTDIIEICRKYL